MIITAVIGSSFLNIGMALASLQRSGKMPVRKDIGFWSGRLKRLHYTFS